MGTGAALLVGLALLLGVITWLSSLAATYAGWIFGGILLLCIAGFVYNGLRRAWLDHRQRREFRRRRQQALRDADDEFWRKSRHIRGEADDQ